MIKKCFIIMALLISISSISTTVQPISFVIDTKKILDNAPSLNPKTLAFAIKGYQWAKSKQSVQNNLLTIIDFNKPSYEKRLWVVNLKTSQILIHTYTTHGKGSGLVYAHAFSNDFNTSETSLGVYKTAQAYYGKHGFSLRIEGLEPGINDNAYERALVIHPASYVSENFVRANHRTGRSWGCFAVDPAISGQLVNTIKNGSVIVAYASAEQKDPNLL